MSRHASAPVAPPQAPQAPQNPQSGPGGSTPGQVPINPNPVNQPNPVGPQAPERPQEQRSQTARDAVQAAFERAKNPPQRQARPPADNKPAAKPAEAKAGHNNLAGGDRQAARSQEAPRGAAGPAPRRARPVCAPRPRPEGDAKAHNGTPTESSNRILQAQSENKLPPHAPFAEPPARISEAARRDWATTPETVRGDVHRLHQEAEGIYRRYRGDFETMETIRPFHQMAQQHGTTLQKALNNYTTMEAKLRADPIAGLDVIVNNLGLKGPNGEAARPARCRLRPSSVSPRRQLRQLQQGNQQVAASPADQGAAPGN